MSSFRNVESKMVNFDEIKANYSCNVLKEWLKDKGMAMMKRFSDECDDAKVKELHNVLSDNYIPIVARYLMEVRTNRTENRFDVASMIPDKVTTYAIGGFSQVKVEDDKLKVEASVFHKPQALGIVSAMPANAESFIDEKARPKGKASEEKKGLAYVDPETKQAIVAVADGGVIGCPPTPVTTIARIAVSCLRNKGTGADIDTKRVTAHALNEFTPEYFVATVKDIQKIASDYNQTKLDFAKHLSANMPRFAELRQNLLNASPKVNKVDMVESILITKGEKKVKSLTVHKASLLYHHIRAEYEPFYNFAQKYLQGTSSGNIGHERRCGYLGVPGSQIFEHFVTLYDAGVKPGQSVLVTSKDVILVSSLRAVFGPKLRGIGSAKGMISAAQARCTEFDYVYVVDTVPYSMSDSVVAATQNFFTSLDSATILATTTKGKRIIKFHPTALFSSVIAEYFGIGLDEYRASLVDDNGKPRAKSEVYPPITSPSMKMRPYDFEPQVFKAYEGPYEDSPLVEGTRKEVLPKVATAEILPFSFVEKQQLPLKLSMCSMVGYCVYVEGGANENIVDIMCQVTGCARLSYAYLWSGQGLCPHSYEIRKMAKLESGAMALLTDEYSPFCGSTILADHDNNIQNKKIREVEEEDVHDYGPPIAKPEVEEEEFDLDASMFESDEKR